MAESGASSMALNIEAAAAELGINRNLMGALVRDGVIPHVNLGTDCIRIGRGALEQWLTAQCLANVREQRTIIPPVRRLRRRAGAA